MLLRTAVQMIKINLPIFGGGGAGARLGQIPRKPRMHTIPFVWTTAERENNHELSFESPSKRFQIGMTGACNHGFDDDAWTWNSD